MITRETAQMPCGTVHLPNYLRRPNEGSLDEIYQVCN